MKKLKERIKNLNLDYKKEISKIFILNLLLIILLVGIIVFYFNLLYIVVISSAFLILNYLYFMRYSKLEIEQKERQIDEFIELFSYFRIYLSNNQNVYMALKAIKEFSSFETANRLDNLLSGIDEDKSIAPFIEFSSYYNNKTIDEVMISLYEMINEGNELLYINQFVRLFEEFKNRRNEDRKIKRYKSFDFLTILALVGSGVIMIILVFGVIGLLGDMNFNGF